MGASVNELFGGAAGHLHQPAAPGTYGLTPPSFRLPPDSHIGDVTLQVSNLSRSRDFYQRILGFRVIDADASRITLGVERGMAPVITLIGRPTPPTYVSTKRLGLFHIAILLPHRADLRTSTLAASRRPM